ncbi:phosphoesterase [Clostridia bacterium]|nr:phosphoesterase [Clostridia bacterium]
MNKRFARLLESGRWLYLLALLVFCCVTAFFSYIAAAAEALIVVCLLIQSRISARKKRREIARYIEILTTNASAADASSTQGFPLPMSVLRVDTGEIVWSNERFAEITGRHGQLFSHYISDLVPGFPTKWLIERKTSSQTDVAVGGKLFTVYTSIVSPDESSGEPGLLAALYWVDCTDYNDIKQKYRKSRPVVSIIMIDNYDELMKITSDSEKSSMLATLDLKVSEWTSGSDGVLRKFERDRMLFIFEEKHLQRFIEGKFSLLDRAREIAAPNGMNLTLSIGVGKDAPSLRENYQQASLGIDMALSRGGDQAVIKNPFTFEFYGGRSKELEKRTKVKSRVMAHSLGELIAASSFVVIMGHKLSDIDCIGAAAGIVCAARKKGKAAYIVCDFPKSVARPVIDRLLLQPEYEATFVSPQDALLWADKDTLLVIVDTNRPDYVEFPELLQSINRVAVVDHHRRAASYIDNAALSFHEPYASSTCELVTELLQYLVDPADILRYEAEALLAGIVLDTKSFFTRTGVRTFEAAAYLRRAGADTVEIKKLFQNDLKSCISRYEFIRMANVYFDIIAISAVDIPSDPTIAAQAADELLNVSGVEASFIVFPTETTTNISARSLGSVNVQLILEKLGGGGHNTMAGAQLADASVQAALERLLFVIEDYVNQTE